MGKPTGFMEYERRVSRDVSPGQRIKNFNEFHEHLTMEEQQEQGEDKKEEQDVGQVSQ